MANELYKVDGEIAWDGILEDSGETELDHILKQYTPTRVRT